MNLKKLGLSLSLLMATGFASADWSSEVANLINTNMQHSFVGVYMVDADSGRVLYSYNAGKMFTPASTTKVLTASTALLVLGPDYTYHTTLNYNPSQVRQGVLYGNVYIKFSGDPTLTSGDLSELLSALNKQGVNTIQGNVIIDASRFEAPDYGFGWTHDSINWAFSAPITAVILNQNQFTLKLQPGKHEGDPVAVTPGDSMRFMSLDHSVRTATYADSLVHCSLVLNIDENNTVHLGGCWPAQYAGWQTLAIKNPVLYAERYIADWITGHNIRINGKVVTGVTPSNTPAVADHSSEPLSAILKTMLKESNDVYAGAITKTLGSAKTGVGTFQEGVNTIKTTLGPISGIDFKQTHISDGSGQSRYDLLSPQEEVQVLYAMYHTKYRDLLMDSLPISGVDGTIRFRMGTDGMLGKVHAKTGSVTGVSTLAGYINTANGHHIVFSIMVNNILGKLTPARNFENKICAAAYRG